tara:strand:- start:265 stop:402 length:138 start_codon:yes stop_codon:yes gene_type:complete
MHQYYTNNKKYLESSSLNLSLVEVGLPYYLKKIGGLDQRYGEVAL